jgi:hypothetical protein
MSMNELSEDQLDLVAGGADDKVVLECEKIGTNDKGEDILLCTEKKAPKKKAPSQGGAPILE